MKKPNIEILQQSADGIYTTVNINGELLCLCHKDENADAIRSMIEALIECHKALSIWGNFKSLKGKEKAESALKKAGVEL